MGGDPVGVCHLRRKEIPAGGGRVRDADAGERNRVDLDGGDPLPVIPAGFESLFISFVLIVFLLFLTWRGLARLGFRLRKDWPDAARRVLIVGAGPLGVRIGTQIGEAGIENMECRGYVDDEITVDEAHPDILGKFCDIRELVNSGAITDVVIALPHSLYQRMSEVVNTTTDLPVKVWVALGFFDLAMFKTEIENFAGVPMVDLRAPALSDYQRLAKRGFDLILGALVFAVATPFMVLIGLSVLIFDGRPVFYLQKRVGENGRVFKMYKFRTMVKNADQMKEIAEKEDAEGNIIHKSENDPRVTQSGAVPAEVQPGRAAAAPQRGPGKHEPGGAAAGNALPGGEIPELAEETFCRWHRG